MKVILLALGICVALPAVADASDFDILIHGGRIADGTGNPSFGADVGIKDGKIAAVGHPRSFRGKTATRTIDATGLVVAPGFVDIHNHSDDSILVDGNAESMVRQGVTSMILGEGLSAAPTDHFPSFHDYFTTVLKKGVSTNIGSYIGSGLVWTRVHGPRGEAPTAGELERMRKLVTNAMEDGALGVASSLGFPPGAWIDTNTLIAMCEAAAPYGGLYSTHTRTEGIGVFDSIQEALTIGQKAKVPVDLIHLKIADKRLWGKMPELIAQIAAARASGQQVEANVYPYRAGHNNLNAIIPPWAQEGGTTAMLDRLRDPKLRPRLENEVLNGIAGSNWYNHYVATGGWDGMETTSFSNPAYKKFEGKRMNEILAAVGGRPIDAFFKVLVDNGGSVPTIYFHHDEGDMRYALKQPFVSVGSDGSALAVSGPLAEGVPHPRSYGTFARVLGKYVREEKLLSLEEAVRKMTSASTAKIHVYDRGLIRPGQWADVAIFDAGKIADLATYEKPKQYAVGVEYVLVNGTPVIDHGKHTGAHPGAILYGPGKK